MTVLEIGSGTGQHACYFARHLPHVKWQPSDKKENLPGIEQWIGEACLENLNSPIELDIKMDPWPVTRLKAVFMANTLHIMSWEEVEILFARLENYFSNDALLCIYGPFNYQGKYTSDSNARFDQWLKSRDPFSGIRDFAAVHRLAENCRLKLSGDVAMPANNRLLIWRK